MISRPIAIVRTHFETFEFFKFLDHTEQTQILHFSTHFDAQHFLRRIVDHADTELLYRLWCEIESPVLPCNSCDVLDLLADRLVYNYLKVKQTPLPRSELSAWEREYFTARFNELLAQKVLASSSSTRSTLVPEVTPPPTPKDSTSLEETPTIEPPPPTTSPPPTISKSMTVAAIQMYSEDGKLQENLNTAEQLAREAKKTNSELDLVLFPELTSPGYGVGPYTNIPEAERQQLAQDLWSVAEPSEQNQTILKMKAVAKDLQVMIGVSFLESDGKDFFVTFVLLGRDGQELGRVRKQKAAAQEAYYVTSVDTPQSHVLTVTDSKLGTLKIGVGICYENYHVQLPCHFQQEGVNLVLQPHSANIMNLDGAPLAKLYATTLGVPVVMVNKYNPDKKFPGNSAIAYFDENGTFDMKRPFKEETKNSSTTEVEPPIEQTSHEQEISFMATFSLKKTTPQPLHCDIIGQEPEYWPEALMQFYTPNLEVPQHLETLEVLQEYIACLERRGGTPPEYLAQLKTLEESIQVNLSGTKGTEREKEFSFKGVEGTGEQFYDETYVKERKNWAEKMAKLPSDSQPNPSETHDDHSDPERHEDESNLG